MSGSIREIGTDKMLYPVMVMNVSTQETTYTGSDGNFTLRAKPGDKILFSLIGYNPVQVFASADMFATKMKIEMSVANYQLQDFILRPKYTPYQIDSLHRQTVYKRSLAWKRTSSPLSPVSFIADRISKKSNTRLAFQRNYLKWEDNKFIDTRYTPELVEQLTGLTGDTLGYFMNAYPMPYDYARASTELELKMWIRYNYKEWVKNPVFPSIDSIQIKK
ncbi:MAG: hypothetical protein JST82_08530 [Bacteroidetes bacterium]|nr:hypothetical protein [Bacteroidota bacterium]